MKVQIVKRLYHVGLSRSRGLIGYSGVYIVFGYIKYVNKNSLRLAFSSSSFEYYFSVCCFYVS